MKAINKLVSLRQKYKDLSAPVKSGFWFTVSNVLTKAIALLATPILTRIMTQEQYGAYSVYHSWVSILTILFTLNLFLSAYIKGLVQFSDEQDKLTSSLFSLSTIITLVFFIVYICFSGFWSNLLNLSPLMIDMMFVEISVLTGFEFWAANQRFKFKYIALVILSILMSFLSLGLSVIGILLTEYKVEARVIIDVAVKAGIALPLIVVILLKGKCIFNKCFWRYALLYNLPLLPHFLSHFILNQSDRIMIGSLCGKSEAAIYSVAYSIAMMMTLVTSAINNAFTPFSYQELKENRILKIKKSSSQLLVLIALLCFFAMAFSPEIIWLFADKSYQSAIWVVPPIAASVFFIFTYSMFANVEYYYKKTVLISIASIVSAGLNIGLNFLLVPKFGYIAAGYTTLFSYIVLAVMHYIFYLRIYKKEKTNYESPSGIFDVKIILFLSITVLLIMGLMLILYRYMWIRYTLILVTVVVAIIKRKAIMRILKFKEM